VIFESFGQFFDNRTSSNVPECSGEKYEGKVGLIEASHLREVYNDWSDCCDYCPIKSEDDCVNDEV